MHQFLTKFDDEDLSQKEIEEIEKLMSLKKDLKLHKLLTSRYQSLVNISGINSV